MNEAKKRAIIIGAGMAGLTSAIRLLEAGFAVTIIESEKKVGGLTGTFEIKNKHFPIGYHHILAGDKPLLKMLDEMGISKDIIWKKIKILFAVDNKTYNLTNPFDFYRFPLSFLNKFRFAILMGYCILKKNWTNSLGDARSWIDNIAGKRVREVVFDPLMDIKYGLPSEYLSANWLGNRLHCQEFSKPLGYLQDDEWTKILVEKMRQKIITHEGEIITGATANKIKTENNKFNGLFYIKDEQEKYLPGEILVNTAPPHVFITLFDFPDEELKKIKYLDAFSMIMEINENLPRNFYLLSCLKPRYSFGGIYVLSSLKPNIGIENKAVLNFFSTLSESSEHLRDKTAEELVDIYLNDFKKIFGFKPQPLWYKLSMIKNYSPKYLNDYQNPSQRYSIKGIYLAGNYLTYPLITSTGSAIFSGETVSNYIKEDYAK